jgi:hypothetical protein
MAADGHRAGAPSPTTIPPLTTSSQRNGPSAGQSWGRTLEVPGSDVRHDSDVGPQSADSIKFWFRSQVPVVGQFDCGSQNRLEPFSDKRIFAEWLATVICST